jgi:DNA-binding SARP family transcriptional activator
MRFRVLGPLRVRNSAGWVPVQAEQQRVVLAVLLANTGTSVSAEELAEVVWADRPPRRPVNTVQAYVMRLRRLLGEDGYGSRRPWHCGVGECSPMCRTSPR